MESFSQKRLKTCQMKAPQTEKPHYIHLVYEGIQELIYNDHFETVEEEE